MSDLPTYDEMMNAPADPVIPFGKHSGKCASQIEVEYLDWLIGQDWLHDNLRDEIEAHLQSRQEWRAMNQ